jgi:hypothetical protein
MTYITKIDGVFGWPLALAVAAVLAASTFRLAA